MPLENSSRAGLEIRRLNVGLQTIIRFFSALTGLKVPVLKVRVSDRIKDLELYTAI